MTAIHGQQLIGYSRSSESNSVFKCYNPATQEFNDCTFYRATEAEVDAALTLAVHAAEQMPQISSATRAQFLKRIAEEIEALGDDLVDMVMQETALPQGRVVGERGRTCNQLRMFAKQVEEGPWVNAMIDHADPERQPVPKPDTRRMLIPIGPVVVFGASNFPLAFSTAGGDTASALAAGNPVIVKAHPNHPGTSELIGDAILRAAVHCNMPDGVFSMLHDDGFETGQRLVSHPAVRAVGFTGSFRGGKALFDLANQREHPIPVFAEMGSINPVLISPTYMAANLESAATKIAGSITLGAGQFCTNPGLIITLRNDHLERFKNALINAMTDIQLHAMLSQNIFHQYEELTGRMLGKRHVTIQRAGDAAEGHVARPYLASVQAADFITDQNLHEEIFGPFSLIVECADMAELQRVVNCLSGQLTATVMAETTELSAWHDVLRSLTGKVGRILFNGVPTGVEVNQSMHHGGPYPATTDSRFTSVGATAIYRWVRPVCYQDWPDEALPEELKDSNPLGIRRLVDGEWTIS